MFRPCFIILFVCSYSFGQSPQVNDSLAQRLLSVSRDYKDIALLVENGAPLSKHRYFAYVPSINPLNPKRLKRFSSKFGKRFHPIDGVEKPHLGIDISAKSGTPIHAAADGAVQLSKSSSSGYGNQVVIVHKFGYKTRYAHMYLYTVEKGDSVKKGDIIGYVGDSGKSTGPHLHYEIWKNGKAIDPYPFCILKNK